MILGLRQVIVFVITSLMNLRLPNVMLRTRYEKKKLFSGPCYLHCPRIASREW